MAVRFDTATDRISYTASNPPSTAAFTITAWAYVSTDTDANATLARLHAATGGTTIATWATGSDGLSGPNYFTTSGSITNATNFAVGAWRKVAIAATGTTGKSYVATVGGATEVDSGTIATGQPTGITLGGRSVGDSSERFDGRLAYVRVWSAELTQVEIEAEWASTTPVKTANLWADWPLTVHTDLTDHSGNGRNLVAGATAVTTEADPPISSSTTGLVAASVPLPTASVAAGVTDTAGMAGSVPLLTAQLAGGVTDQAVVAASVPMPAAAAAGAVTDPGAFTASVPLQTAAVTAGVSQAGELTASVPMLQATIGADVRADVALATSVPMPVAGLAVDVLNAGVVTAAIPLPVAQWAGSNEATTGALAAAIPLPTATVAATVTTTGVLAGNLPVPAASFAATVADLGVLAAAIPLQAAHLSAVPQIRGPLHAAHITDRAVAGAGVVVDTPGLVAAIS